MLLTIGDDESGSEGDFGDTIVRSFMRSHVVYLTDLAKSEKGSV